MRHCRLVGALYLTVAFLIPWSRADDVDDDLAPSRLTGADVQSLLKPEMMSDDVHQELQTTPALVRKNRLHWQLADGSLWTDFVPTARGARIIGWILESESANATGGEADELDRLFSRYYLQANSDKLPRVIELAGIVGMLQEEHSRQVFAAFLTPIISETSGPSIGLD